MKNNNNEIKLNVDELKKYNNLYSVSERKELIGQTLQYLRLATGITQKELSEYLGIKPVTYSTYENGTREIPAEILVRISILYGMPTDLILQKDRLIRDDFDVNKQIEQYNDTIDELKDIIKAPELNEDVKNMINAMTEAFENLGKAYEEQLKKDD